MANAVDRIRQSASSLFRFYERVLTAAQQAFLGFQQKACIRNDFSGAFRMAICFGGELFDLPAQSSLFDDLGQHSEHDIVLNGFMKKTVHAAQRGVRHQIVAEFRRHEYDRCVRVPLSQD